MQQRHVEVGIEERDASFDAEGQFLKTKHTLKHYRERWYPKLFERATYESWLKDGGKTMNERAGEKIEQILKKHKPETLPAKVKEKIRKIVQRAKIEP